MESKAISRYLRVSSSKVRLVANEIRGVALPEAIDILKTIPRKGSKLVLKTLYSAGANAKFNNPDIREEDLYIKKITIDEGPMMKRFRATARGKAQRIRKRMSTVTIVLSNEG